MCVVNTTTPPLFPLERPSMGGRYSDSPRAASSGVRIPMWTRFSLPVQTGLKAHQTSCTMCTKFLSRGYSGVNHPLLSTADVEEWVELYRLLFLGPSWRVIGRTLPLSSTHYVGGWGYRAMRKIWPPLEYEPWIFKPIASSYTDYAIPARIFIVL